MSGGGSVRLFGRFEVTTGMGHPVRFATERSRRLLALLVLGAGAPRSRERLTDALWDAGDETRVRHSLNTEVWRLRRALAEAGEDAADWISADGPDLAFRADGPVRADVLEFDASLKTAERAPDRAGRLTALTAAAALYAGELAPGVYADWCLLAREAYRGRFLAALEALLELHRDGRRWPAAIDCARRILAEDPFLEHVHRELMRCLALMGDRAAAIRHYEGLRVALRAELDVEPTPETRALRDLLKTDGELPGPPPPPLAAAPDHQAQLHKIRRGLLQAARELGAISRSRTGLDA